MFTLLRRYGGLSLLFFVVGALLGAVFASQLQHILLPFIKDIRHIGVTIKREPLWEEALTIFVHNLGTSLLMMAGGLLLGVIPLASVTLNGAVIGYVLVILTQETHVNPFLLFAAGILPHGLFEVSAYLLASGFGMEVGVTVVRSIIRRSGTREQWRMLGQDAGKTVLWVTLLLFVAAWIETGVTPHLLAMVVGRHGA